MKNACKLPVAVSGALMPDAHVGYGLPIGGVLATRDAVIPYAVGVDIACRMKLTVLDLPVSALDGRSGASDARARARDTLRHGRLVPDRAASTTCMDADWRVTSVTVETEGSRLGAARHERERQSLRRVRPAHRARRRGGTRRAASTSRSSATPAAAAPARRSRSTTAGWRASSIPSCRRSCRIWRGSICRPRPARSTGRRWS